MDIYLPIAELPVNMLVILGMGLAVGFISGLFGIGGGFLMTPLLIFIGIPPDVAVATGASQIAASSVTGALAYWRRKALDVKLGVVLLVGGSVGTQFGVAFFNAMRSIGQLDTVITVSYVVLLGGVGCLMLVESINAMRRKAGGVHATSQKKLDAWWAHLPGRMRFERAKIEVSVIPLLALALVIGFAGAVLGIGGGFILVPVLIYVFGVSTLVVVGTSLFQILFTMLGATILHATSNHSVDVVLALLLIIGGVVGVQFGARAGATVRPDQFRMLLAVLLLGVALRFALELFVAPTETFSASATETRR